MAITTYSELKAAIANWLVRQDLTDRIPECIALAEATMNRDIEHWRGEKRATATLDARFSAVPDDYIAPIRFQVDTVKCPLEPISPQDMHERRAMANDTAGTPEAYALVGTEFEFFPTPAESHTGTLYYRAAIPALSDSNASNWVLENAPDIYLYGSLIASAPLLQEDARLATWQPLYSGAVAAFNLESGRGKFSGGGLKKRMRR